MANFRQTLLEQLSSAREELARPGSRIRVPRFPVVDGGQGPGHFHLRPELFLQRSGTTRFVFAQQTLDLGPSEVLLVPARVHHAEQVMPTEQPFGNVVIYGQAEALACHWAEGTVETGPRIAYPEHREEGHCVPLAVWLTEAARLASEPEPLATVAVDLVRAAIGLTQSLLLRPGPRDRHDPLPIATCLRMIHEELGNPHLSVSLLARRLSWSADYLSHRFCVVRGERLTAYVEEQRLLRAAELLRSSGLSCKEVAWASGFRNQSYFNRCFVRRWRLTPAQWRESSGGP